MYGPKYFFKQSAFFIMTLPEGIKDVHTMYNNYIHDQYNKFCHGNYQDYNNIVKLVVLAMCTIANQAPQFLKMEKYDNSGSSQTLYNSFTVSQQITEKKHILPKGECLQLASASSIVNLEASLNAGGSLTLSAARIHIY
jgi:hypothetical protein